MNLKRLNKIFGWAVFAIALLIYGITMEKTASFWDCGEFIAAAHKLQIVHPPGAPIYLMLGRLFSFFLPPEQVALGVNFLSAFSTALAAMFVFWSTTILAKRILKYKVEKSTKGEVIAILGAGLVAAFAFIFQDSQWFNAVEAEVYAVSTGLTAAVIYMALKWSEIQDKPGADRWLMAIALIIGLSLGVHLLNLLVIPTIALLYYFYRSETFTWKGLGLAFIIGAVILLFIQYGVILELPKLASGIEVKFVNDFGLPFGSGILFLTVLVFLIPILLVLFINKNKPLFLYIALGIVVFLALSQFFKSGSITGNLIKALITAGIGYGIYYFRAQKDVVYKLSLGFFFIMIGYLSYMFVPIRSSANTPIDINNPDNVFSVLSYLNREQYGDRPLLHGPHFNAQVQGTNKIGDVYTQQGDEYVVIDDKIEYRFRKEDQLLFPRAWDFREERKTEAYREWLNMNQVKFFIESEDPEAIETLKELCYESNSVKIENIDSGFSATFLMEDVELIENQLARAEDYFYFDWRVAFSQKNNLKFFYTHQLDFMYWRYFMWNFAGRQNSEQSHGEVDVGNWESGFTWADKHRIVLADVYPDKMGNNPSKNHFYFIPFVFGILGLILQWKFARKDAIAIVGLFLLTGIAIVIYLNQEPLQPRERDYAYVGSFLAFAVWIGLSVVGLYRASKELLFNDIGTVMQSFAVIFTAMIIMGFGTNNPASLIFIALITAIMVLLIFAAAVAMKHIKGNLSAILIASLAAIAPVLMGFVGWEDHNRNQLHLAKAVGANYLTSCDQNSILFTEGDNDTYPLWYSQEVEGTRPDVRIVNNSLLQADWYANQIRQPNGNQDGLMLSFDPEDYAAGKREVIYLRERLEEMSLQDLIRFIKSDEEITKIQTPDGDWYDYFPARNFTLAIDSTAQVNNGLIQESEADAIVDTMKFRLKGSNLIRDQYLILDLIQRNINKRPIYFTGENLPSVLGLSAYTRREGASIRLLPVINPDFGTRAYSEFDPPINGEKTLAYFKNGMDWGNIESGVYLEETGQRQVMRILDYAATMIYDFADNDEKEKALETYGFVKDYIYPSSLSKDEIYYIFKNTGIIDALLLLEENEEALPLIDQTCASAITLLNYHQTTSIRLANSKAIQVEMIRVLSTNTDAYLRIGENEKAYETAKIAIDPTVDFLQIELAKEKENRDDDLLDELISILEAVQSSAEEHESQEILNYLENVLE